MVEATKVGIAEKIWGKFVVVTDNSRNVEAVVTSTLRIDRAKHYPCQARFISTFLKSKFFNQL